MNRFISTSIGFLALAGGIAIAVFFVKTKPEATRKRPPRMTPIVACAPLTNGVHCARLEVMGTVVAARSIELKARVTGQIVSATDDWIEGGRLTNGATIMKLEDDDYRIALTRAESDYTQAQSALTLELGRQDIAKRELTLLGHDKEEGDHALALRTPQLESARARVDAAAAMVKQADLNLKRTTIAAPFNALVTARHLNVGDQVTPQVSLGRLVDTDRYHIQASVPVDELKWVTFPQPGQPGSTATVRLADGQTKTGQVIKLLGDLGKTGRMARVLIDVPDPLAGKTPMLLGSYVQVEIMGACIPDAYAISREQFREGSEIWLLTRTNTLRVVSIVPTWTSRDTVVFTTDLAEGERLITSDLAVVVDGTELRVAGETPPGETGKKEPGPGKGRPSGKRGPEGEGTSRD